MLKLKDIYTKEHFERYCRGIAHDISNGILDPEKGALQIGALAIACEKSGKYGKIIPEILKMKEYSSLNDA